MTMHNTIINTPAPEQVDSAKYAQAAPEQARRLIGNLPERKFHRIHTEDYGWQTIPMHLVYRVAGFPVVQPEYVCKIRRAHLEEALILHQIGYFSAIHNHPGSVHQDGTARSSFYNDTLQSVSGLLEKAFPMFSASTFRRRIKSLEKGKFIIVNKDQGDYGYFSVKANNEQRLAFQKNGMRLSLSPALAKEIGLIESILLLQLDFLINYPKHTRKRIDANGITWLLMTLRSYEQNSFPFLSHKTILEYFRRLKASGYLWMHFDRKSPIYHRKTRISLNYASIQSLKSVRQIAAKR